MRSMMWVAVWTCLVACGDSAPAEPTPATPTAASEGEQGAVYECPMHCKLKGHDEPYTQNEPGKCPVCGMKLEQKTDE